METKIRLGYLVTHPIQYQAPMLRQLSKVPWIDLEVAFCSPLSMNGYFDKEFNRIIRWDVPLTSGYRSSFLKSFGTNKIVNFWRPFNFGLLKFLKEKKIQILLIHGYNRFFHWWAILLCKLLRIRVMIRDEAWEKSRKRDLKNKILNRIRFYILNEFVDQFLAIGTNNLEYYKKMGIPSRKIDIAPYAVDNSFFKKNVSESKTNEIKKMLKIPSDAPVILYASKLMARKNANLLLDSFKLFVQETNSKAHLIFVGDGELFDQLKKFSEENVLSQTVHMVGFKNQRELKLYYDLCDVFILPSSNEAWGLVINEAMAHGKAVIASEEVGCAKDLIENGNNGYIFKLDEKNSLFFSIKAILKSKDIAQSMGKNSLRKITPWNISKTVEGILRGIKKCL